MTDGNLNHSSLGLGIIGCGGFGLFALQHFAQVPGVRPVAMAGTHREAAKAAALRFGIPDITEIPTLLAHDDVDLVYIATPLFCTMSKQSRRYRPASTSFAKSR